MQRSVTKRRQVYQPAVERRSSRWGRKLVVSALVLALMVAGLLFVADRVGAWYAERRIAEEVRQQVASRAVNSDMPEVEVGGFPFLTQVLSGEYESISIVLRNLDGEGVRLPRLDVQATGVHADLDTIRSGQGVVRADRVTGTATVGYGTVATLTKQPGLKLSADNGKLRVRLPAQILGQQVNLVGTAKVTVDGNQVRVSVSNLDDEGGELPARARSAAKQYAQRLSVTLTLPLLPFNLTLDGVTVEPDGLSVTATARGVPITS